jgi:hypothetical protein
MSDALTSVYQGARFLHFDMESALRQLGKRLVVTPTECQSHTLLTIDGFGSRGTLEAAAVYLVGSVAQCVQADLQIRQALFDEATFARDLAADVVAVIGGESADETFKTMRRDPWIWEGISHLVIHLARDAADFHPTGKVLAKTQLKHDVNDHGLDLIAIYERGSLGITAGESKAYLDDPARAVGDASTRLSEIDQNLRDVELRAAVTQLRNALPLAQQQMLGGAFWRQERTYYPFICCDQAAAPDWRRKRKSLGDLNLAVSRKVLVPFAMRGARQTFDRISSLMRGYADGSLTSWEVPPHV